jgi:hypothetical protein
MIYGCDGTGSNWNNLGAARIDNSTTTNSRHIRSGHQLCQVHGNHSRASASTTHSQQDNSLETNQQFSKVEAVEPSTISALQAFRTHHMSTHNQQLEDSN